MRKRGAEMIVDHASSECLSRQLSCCACPDLLFRSEISRWIEHPTLNMTATLSIRPRLGRCHRQNDEEMEFRITSTIRINRILFNKLILKTRTVQHKLDLNYITFGIVASYFCRAERIAVRCPCALTRNFSGS